jgi:hypothetical protein
MPTCCVEGCTRRSRDVTYHRFPTKPQTLVDEWQRRTGVIVDEQESGRRLSVCSRHFVDADFEGSL